MKPVKVSGFISSDMHFDLYQLAEARNTTIGVLVAFAVRRLVETPIRSLRGLPLDGRSKKAKALKKRGAR